MATTARASERKLDVLKNHGDNLRSSRSPMKQSDGDLEGVNMISSDLLAPVRFNILGQMQIPGKMHSPTIQQGLMNQINSAFSLHPSHSGIGLGSSHHRNRKSHNNNNNSNKNNTRQCSSSPEPDSPLDFSTKKAKLEEPLPKECPESPSSRLRNILSMKSPLISEDLEGGGDGTALNLSKESPSSNSSSVWSKSNSRGSLTSSPLSPSMENPQQTSLIPSPRAGTNPVSLSAATGHHHHHPNMFSGVGGGGNGTPYPLSFSPWGNGVFSPSLSPVLNQSAVPTGAGIGLPSIAMDPSVAAMFPHQITIATANTSPGGMQFSPPGHPSANNNNNGSSANKTRAATRPFKAYPKDPMTFSSVGLYGLSMGPAAGGTESLMHQQSNQAYAEFRKQMLASSQMGRTRRVGQKNGGLGESDSSEHGDGLSFGMSLEQDSLMADSSPENDGKSRLGKSEQQMKDEAYWERRRKNNEAAKRSRDARRAKEDEIAIRAAFLEQENLKLRFELCALKNETAKLRCMLYST